MERQPEVINGGIKMTNKQPEEYDIAIAIINSLIETAEMNNWTNEQWFLDWIDEINKLSITY